MNDKLIIAQKDSLICEMFQILKACRIILMNRDQNEMEMQMVSIIRDVMNKCLDQKVEG